MFFVENPHSNLFLFKAKERKTAFRDSLDIDIPLGIGPEYLNKMLDLVQKCNFRVLPDDIEIFVQRTMVLPLLYVDTGIRIDFI